MYIAAHHAVAWFSGLLVKFSLMLALGLGAQRKNIHPAFYVCLAGCMFLLRRYGEYRVRDVYFYGRMQNFQKPDHAHAYLPEKTETILLGKYITGRKKSPFLLD